MLMMIGMDRNLIFKWIIEIKEETFSYLLHKTFINRHEDSNQCQGWNWSYFNHYKKWLYISYIYYKKIPSDELVKQYIYIF